MKAKNLFFCFNFLMLATFCAHSAQQQANLHEYSLKNGLKIIVKEDHRAPVVATQIWYKVGSSYEPAGITGISHALEHMMFKGTPRHPNNTFSRTIAQNGGSENAFTSLDYTAYHQKFSADKLALSFELEADRMQNLTLSPQEFAKEIEVVKEERRWRTDNNPQNLTHERFSASAFIANTYHHPTVGWPSDLNNMSIEDLSRWYQSWYAPNNAILVVVGDVDPKQVLSLAEKYFAPILPRTLPPVKPHDEVKPLGIREVTVKVPAKLPLLIMGYNVPSLKTAKDPKEAYALRVLAEILGGDSSSRFEKNLVRNAEIASDIDAGYDLSDRLSTLLMIEARPNVDKTTQQLREAIQLEINNIKQHPVTAQELERVKTQVIASNIYMQDSIYYQAYLLGSFESVGLSWRDVINFPQKIREVNAKQVQQVANKYLNEDYLTIGLLEPQALSTSDTATTEEANDA